MKFPEQQLRKSWYRPEQTYDIIALEFDHCDFTSIEAGAFEHTVFYNLQQLTIQGQSSFEYQTGMFNGLKSLLMLNLSGTGIHDVGDDIFLPVRETLMFITLDKLFCNFDFNNAFGVYKMLRFTSLEVRNSVHLRTLAYSNFTGLRTLQHLIIRDSQLEYILMHAFDYISITLRDLELINNRLKTLPIGLFNKFIEHNFNSFHKVSLNTNPWRCDCELLETIFVTTGFYNELPGSVSPLAYCPLTVNSSVAAQCSNLQILHKNRICMRFPSHTYVSINKYLAYVKYLLKIDATQTHVYVNSSVPRCYRLWIADYARIDLFGSKRNRQCPSYNWLRMATKCIGVRKYMDTIALPEVAQRRFKYRMICLNYVAPRNKLSFWPLHCIAYRIHSQSVRPLKNQRTDSNFLYGIGGGVGFLCGCLLAYLYKKEMEWRNKSSDRERITMQDNKCGDFEAAYDYYSIGRNELISELSVTCEREDTNNGEPKIDSIGYIVLESNI